MITKKEIANEKLFSKNQNIGLIIAFCLFGIIVARWIVSIV